MSVRPLMRSMLAAVLCVFCGAASARAETVHIPVNGKQELSLPSGSKRTVTCIPHLRANVAAKCPGGKCIALSNPATGASVSGSQGLALAVEPAKGRITAVCANLSPFEIDADLGIQ